MLYIDCLQFLYWILNSNLIRWTQISLCPSGWHCFPSFWAFPSRLCLVTPSLLLQECCTDSHPLERSEHRTKHFWVTLHNIFCHYWLNDGRLCAFCVSEVTRWATLNCSTKNRVMKRNWQERQTVQCRESPLFTSSTSAVSSLSFSLHITTCIMCLTV